jgi:hypothetical protein
VTLRIHRAGGRGSGRDSILALATGLVAILLAVAPAAADAAGLGPVVRLGNPGTAPAVALAPDGSGFAVWAGPHDAGRGVYGRRVNAAGRTLSGVVRLSGPSADTVVGRPSITFNPVGAKYLVAWTAPGAGVRHRSVAATGALLGTGPSTLPDVGPDGACIDLSGYGVGASTALATSGSGESLLVWGCSEGSYTSSVLVRRFNRDGAPVGTTFAVGDAGYTGAYGQLSPSVAANPRTGEYLVTFAYGQRPDPARTVAQRLAGDGRLVGATRFAVSAPGASFQSAAVAHPNGEFLVAWPARDGRVLTQRLTPAGAATGADDLAVLTGTPATSVAAAVNAATGQYVVAGGGERGVIARPLGPNGAPLEAGPTVVATSPTTSVAAAASPAGGGFLLAWDGLDARAVSGALR